MQVPFRLVDVFTERPLAGNQLCVVPETPPELDGATMQALAVEIGFSETTFVTSVGEDRYAMRIFTPAAELPFAGHPTLGTAFVMVSEGFVTGTSAIQEVTAGEIPVEVDVGAGFVWMRQLPPRFGPEVADPDRIAAAAGLVPEELHPELPPQVMGSGIDHVMVGVRDLDPLRRATRASGAIRALCAQLSVEALYLFALTDEGATARMFDRSDEIGEDPATGSAAGPLGAYLAARGVAGMPGTMTVHQGEQVGRPSVLHVEVETEGDSWRVRVGGGVRVVGRGRFEL